MKSTTFLTAIVSAIVLTCFAHRACACGPYSPIIPTPDFFVLPGLPEDMPDYNREENLRLWQELTSERIPLSDIEKAVYEDSRSEFLNSAYASGEKNQNLFYVYLKNTNDNEIVNLLDVAKAIEEKRSRISSPWYYPRDRDINIEADDFNYLIEICKEKSGDKRLGDRYSLQMTRILFATHRYADCIEYCDSAFADIPDDNLMKRMAFNYVAGCWSAIGDIARADSLFAITGEVLSISSDNPVAYMAAHNHDAPQLMDYIRSNASDTLFLGTTASVAKNLLNNNKVSKRGDWNFLIAYNAGEYERDLSLARTYIKQALREDFSSDNLCDLARCYKMKLDARAGDISSLLSDLKWFEMKFDVLNIDLDEWVRRCRNIIYEEWCPILWKRGDYAAAVMLCAYADNLNDSFYLSDYGCLSFRLMESLRSEQLEAVYEKMNSSNALFNFLRKHIRSDRDYYYELIGTLAIREGNYGRAVDFLSQVSDSYIKSMNIYSYLSRKPFCLYKKRWEKVTYYGYTYVNDYGASGTDDDSATKYTKLYFAREMKQYQHDMKHGLTTDDRGLARLMYAIGRYNSFEECWALTQYSRGYVYLFEPSLYYYDDDFAEKNYAFLYDYLGCGGQMDTEREFEREKTAALAMLTGDEARAQAQYILRNLKTVVKYYADTATGKFVRASCDNWRSWL